jgi:hypothetical protein
LADSEPSTPQMIEPLINSSLFAFLQARVE